jgi:hypothetical protein
MASKDPLVWIDCEVLKDLRARGTVLTSRR